MRFEKSHFFQRFFWAYNKFFFSKSNSILPAHVAVIHVDPDKDGNRPDYICDGNSVKADEEDPECSVERKFSTPAVNEFVDHMKSDHPNQVRGI